jgi:3-hydroxyisobutyrate dehydrogenase-like beta-hydroxyacid dehydrogenase
MSELKIGFVGLGDQGAPMAEAISDAGFELHVWARRAQSFDAISRVKYLRHDNLESLAVMVDVLSLCLRDGEDIWSIKPQSAATTVLPPFPRALPIVVV